MRQSRVIVIRVTLTPPVRFPFVIHAVGTTNAHRPVRGPVIRKDTSRPAAHKRHEIPRRVMPPVIPDRNSVAPADEQQRNKKPYRSQTLHATSLKITIIT